MVGKRSSTEQFPVTRKYLVVETPPIRLVDVHCADGIHVPPEDEIQQDPDADFLLPMGQSRQLCTPAADTDKLYPGTQLQEEDPAVDVEFAKQGVQESVDPVPV